MTSGASMFKTPPTEFEQLKGGVEKLKMVPVPRDATATAYALLIMTQKVYGRTNEPLLKPYASISKEGIGNGKVQVNVTREEDRTVYGATLTKESSRALGSKGPVVITIADYGEPQAAKKGNEDPLLTLMKLTDLKGNALAQPIGFFRSNETNRVYIGPGPSKQA